jgi:hypothetical protein
MSDNPSPHVGSADASRRSEEELQFMLDEAAVYCRAARKHIAAGDWQAAAATLLAQIKKHDIALQSLTPGGSEYVGDPDRCVAHVVGMKERYRSAALMAIRQARVEAASEDIPF